MSILTNLLTLGIKPLYNRHNVFFKILNEFRLKLPRPQQQAQTIPESELVKNPMFSSLVGKMNVIDLSTQKSNLTESDIDEFYNKLEHFNYNFIIFKKYYQERIRNLKRFDPKATNKDFHTAIIITLLEESSSNPLRPFPILLYHLKYKYKLTSNLYLRKMNKKRKKTTPNKK
jgi:hypothetical protein